MSFWLLRATGRSSLGKVLVTMKYCTGRSKAFCAASCTDGIESAGGVDFAVVDIDDFGHATSHPNRTGGLVSHSHRERRSNNFCQFS